MSDGYRLCYVDGAWAWFVSDHERAWGDDWNDAPHFCNAGDPYTHHGNVDYVKVAWDAPTLECFGTSGEDDPLGVGNGWYSVEQFNNGEAPWICEITYGTKPCRRKHEIWGGITLAEFREQIEAVQGRVYEA